MYLYNYVTFLSTEIQFMYPNADKKYTMEIKNYYFEKWWGLQRKRGKTNLISLQIS